MSWKSSYTIWWLNTRKTLTSSQTNVIGMWNKSLKEQFLGARGSCFSTEFLSLSRPLRRNTKIRVRIRRLRSLLIGINLLTFYQTLLFMGKDRVSGGRGIMIVLCWEERTSTGMLITDNLKMINNLLLGSLKIVILT